MSKQMRILYITPSFSFKQGGVSEVVYQLSNHLSKRGHQVTLLTSNYLTEECDDFNIDFNIIRLPSYSHSGFFVTPKMFSWLRKNHNYYDIIHLHEYRTFQNIVAGYIEKKISKPFVFSAHGTIPNIIEKRLIKFLFDVLFKRLILTNIDAFTAVSLKEIDDYKKLKIHPDHIKLIFNGINVQEYNEYLDQSLNRKERKNKKKIIGFLGRLHKLKRIDRLITAFSEVLIKYPDSQLIIAGPDNGELNKLQYQARELGIISQVSFHGPIFGKKKIDFYQKLDVLAYPSSYEVFGLVPFEALLSGTPVVVSKGTGMGDLIDQIHAGQTVSQENPQALADALLWVLDNPKNALNQVIKGQLFIKEKMSWTIISQQYEKLYLKLLDDCLLQ